MGEGETPKIEAEYTTLSFRQIRVPLIFSIGFVVVCVVCWFLIRPSAGSVPAELPRATLSIGGQAQASPVGTYCWYAPPICSDRWQATQSVALKSPADVRATLSFTGNIVPTEVTVHTNALSDKIAMRSERPSGISVWDWMSQPKGMKFQVKPVLNQDIAVPLKPGRYLIDVFATWGARGDTAHTFLIDVTEGN